MKQDSKKIQEFNSQLGKLNRTFFSLPENGGVHDLSLIFAKQNKGAFGTNYIFDDKIDVEEKQSASYYISRVIAWMESRDGELTQFTNKGSKLAGGIWQVNMKWLYPDWGSYSEAKKLRLGKEYEKKRTNNLVQANAVFQDTVNVTNNIIKRSMPGNSSIKPITKFALIMAGYNGGPVDNETARNINAIVNGKSTNICWWQ